MLQTCRLCGAELTHTFADLGMSPLRESYVATEQLEGPETFYPLHEAMIGQLGLGSGGLVTEVASNDLKSSEVGV